jgi:hypothetical protein
LNAVRNSFSSHILLLLFLVSQESNREATQLVSSATATRVSTRNQSDIEYFQKFVSLNPDFLELPQWESMVWRIHDKGFPVSIVIEATKIHLCDETAVTRYCRRWMTSISPQQNRTVGSESATIASQNQNQVRSEQPKPATQDYSQRWKFFTGEEALAFDKCKRQNPKVFTDELTSARIETEMAHARALGFDLKDIMMSVVALNARTTGR